VKKGETVNQPFKEERSPTRFGVSASVLQQAEHLRDVVFPQAGVTLFIQNQKAFAVTPERMLVPVAPLETLVQMTESEVTDLIGQILRVHQQQSQLQLRELR
jgi:hypothetical protein